MYKLFVTVAKDDAPANFTLIPAGWIRDLPPPLETLPERDPDTGTYVFPELHTALSMLDYVAEGITARRAGWDFPSYTLSKLSEHRQWLTRLIGEPGWITRVWLIEIDCSTERTVTVQFAETLPAEQIQVDTNRSELIYGRVFDNCTPEIEVTIPPLDFYPEMPHYTYRDFLNLLELYDVEPGQAVRLHPRKVATLLDDVLSNVNRENQTDEQYDMLRDLDLVPYYVVVTERK